MQDIGSALFTIIILVVFIIIIAGIMGLSHFGNRKEKMKLRFHENMSVNEFNNFRNILNGTNNYIAFQRAYPNISASQFQRLRALNKRGELRNIDIELAVN